MEKAVKTSFEHFENSSKNAQVAANRSINRYQYAFTMHGKLSTGLLQVDSQN